MMKKLALAVCVVAGFTLPICAQIREESRHRLPPPVRGYEDPSMIEIFPQIVTVYPGDTQRFTLRGIKNPPSPALWSAILFGTVQSDYSLEATAGSMIAWGNYYLKSGLGQVVFTLDSQSVPTSSGITTLVFNDTSNLSSAYASDTRMEVAITATNIAVKKYNAGTLTTTTNISESVASGDEIKLEVAGTIFRLYRNDVLKTTFTPAAGIVYPCFYVAGLDTPMAASPMHLLAPELRGDGWGGQTNGDWTAPAHGTLSTTNGEYTNYSGVSVPGVYTLSASVGSSALQASTATIIVPPLSILNDLEITLQPGEKFTFKTNYDSAQTSIVTWSVDSGGGSFTNGEYTAATAPGTAVLLATSGAQEARVTVTVPAVMTIKTSANEDVTAATLGEVLTLSTNMTGTVNWTASVGTLSASSGATVTWTAPNQSQLVGLIKATNGTYTVTAEIPVLKEFPYVPNRSLKWDRKKTVLISRAEDRRRAARVKDYNNEAFEAFELTFLNRNLAELSAVHTFWDDHHPDKRFIFTDEHRDVRKVVYFDSDISHDAAATCATTYSFRVIEG